jgi:hypothetical protein
MWNGNRAAAQRGCKQLCTLNRPVRITADRSSVRAHHTLLPYAHYLFGFCVTSAVKKCLQLFNLYSIQFKVPNCGLSGGRSIQGTQLDIPVYMPSCSVLRKQTNKLRGLSPRANYTDRATVVSNSSIASPPPPVRSSTFLLDLASTVILGSEYHGTHGHILLSNGSESLMYTVTTLWTPMPKSLDLRWNLSSSPARDALNSHRLYSCRAKRHRSMPNLAEQWYNAIFSCLADSGIPRPPLRPRLAQSRPSAERSFSFKRPTFLTSLFC